jgi:hypothetical protein
MGEEIAGKTRASGSPDMNSSRRACRPLHTALTSYKALTICTNIMPASVRQEAQTGLCHQQQSAEADCVCANAACFAHFTCVLFSLIYSASAGSGGLRPCDSGECLKLDILVQLLLCCGCCCGCWHAHPAAKALNDSDHSLSLCFQSPSTPRSLKAQCTQQPQYCTQTHAHPLLFTLRCRCCLLLSPAAVSCCCSH